LCVLSQRIVRADPRPCPNPVHSCAQTALVRGSPAALRFGLQAKPHATNLVSSAGADQATLLQPSVRFAYLLQ
jgi:hypothetical protein